MDILNELDEIFSGLISRKITSEEASARMKDKPIYPTMNAYINKESINPTTPLEDSDVLIMQKMVDILQFIYNDSGAEPPISDTDYDKLYELMVYAGGGEIVGYSMPDVDPSKILHHKYPTLRGTLKKVYYLTSDEKRTNPSRKYLDEWKKSAEQMIYDATGKRVDLDKEEIYVFPKWDGVSAIQEIGADGVMERALTRGDTTRNIAYDITRHLKVQIPKSPLRHDVKEPHGIKYEVMMREKELNEYNTKYRTDYKSTRSIVSSILNTDDTDSRDNFIKFVPLRYRTETGEEKLHPDVFKYPSLKCTLGDRDAIREFANKNKFVDGLRTDGAVIYIINPELQKILGRTDNKNNFEVAYKFTEEVASSKITDVLFSVKNFGRITPIAEFKPVKMKGNTVSHATIGSKARFDSLCLAKGDEVRVHYDIIPYITIDPACERSGKSPIEFPSVCPKCGQPITFNEDGAIAKCDNPDCPSKISGKIVNFLSKMKIKNISFATVDLLKKNGFLDGIPDLYKLHKHKVELSQIPSLGIVSAEKIISSIDEKKTVYDYELFGAVGIEGVSRKIFKKIFEVYSVEDLLDLIKDDKSYNLCEIKGIKDATANKISDGIKSNMKTLKFLMKKLEVLDSSGEDGPSFSVCFTKVRDPHLEDLVSDLGGETVDNVTKTTSLLVVPDMNTTSGKVSSAKDKGVPIVEYKDAEEYIKSHWG